jgi:hypothetical protein
MFKLKKNGIFQNFKYNDPICQKKNLPTDTQILLTMFSNFLNQQIIKERQRDLEMNRDRTVYPRDHHQMSSNQEIYRNFVVKSNSNKSKRI